MSEKPRKKRFGRIRSTLPRMPWQRRATGIGSSISFAKSALRRARAECPSCQTGHLKVTKAIDHDGTDDEISILACNNCDHTQNIEFELDNVAERIADLRLGERRFLISALVAFGFGLIYMYATGNVFTVIGATMIATFLFANALVFRYRVWQLSHSKLFQTKAPWGEWLRYEFSNKSADD